MTDPDRELESPRWQWTLLDLMIWTAYAAAFCATVGFFDVAHDPFMGSYLFLSLLLTFALMLSGIHGTGVIGIVGYIGWAFYSIPLMANCGMHLGFLIWKKYRNKPVSKKVAINVSLFLLFASIGGGLAFGLGPYREILKLRQRLPIQNLAPRLEYARVHADAFKSLEPDATPPLTARWKDFELTLLTDLGTWSAARNHYLRKVHDREIESIVKSQGFGSGKMVVYKEHFYPTANGILPELKNVPFHLSANSQQKPFDEGNHWITPQWRVNEGLTDFHFHGLLDFLNTTTFGLMMQPQVTVGFEPHAFHYSAEPVQFETNKFRLSSLQLVSLFRFEEPRVYVLDYLPRMDRLNGEGVLTRDLSEFESDSLKKIRENNRDGVIAREENSLLMLGSIRAVQSCLNCHEVKRGELLGAFSYRFDPIQEANQN